jgi:hypothetical protein
MGVDDDGINDIGAQANLFREERRAIQQLQQSCRGD